MNTTFNPRKLRRTDLILGSKTKTRDTIDYKRRFHDKGYEYINPNKPQQELNVIEEKLEQIVDAYVIPL